MPTLTINTTTEQAQRVSAAFGKAMGLVDGNGDPRGANNAEVKQHVIRYIINVVKAQEDKAASDAAKSGVTEIEPT